MSSKLVKGRILKYSSTLYLAEKNREERKKVKVDYYYTCMNSRPPRKDQSNNQTKTAKMPPICTYLFAI